MKNLLYILVIAVTLTSCSMEAEEEISWNIEKHPDMLVVHSVITNEYKEQAVFLSLTNSYFDNAAPRSVSNATVVIEGGAKPVHFSERSDTPGLYYSEEPFACEPQRTYKLSITLAQAINGQNTYTALSRMPQGVNIDSMNCELYEMPEFTEEGDDDKDKDTTIIGIYYFGQEPQQAENFYFTRIFVNDKLTDNNPTEYDYFSITAENANYTHMKGYIHNAGANDNVKLRLYAVEKKYYNYLEALHKMEETGNAYSMSGPPANAIGNISEGQGLGYFLAAYVSEKTGQIVDKRKRK
ncbi:MAG TPA: DUF4249 domain-containing protein [Bacteroidales bacterium]|nr:DUF4249 domain-containing protein [Bacteroidales bacterium]